MDRKRLSIIRYPVGILLGLFSIICLSCCSDNSENDAVLYKTEVRVEPTEDNVLVPNASGNEIDAPSGVVRESNYPINLNQIGFRQFDKKMAAVNCDDSVDSFQVLDVSGNTVFSGKLEGKQWDSVNKSIVKFADFSEFRTEGSYYIICGDDTYSDEFSINEDVYEDYYKPIGAYFSDVKKNADLQSRENNPTGIKARLFDTGVELDVTGGWCNLKDKGQYVVDSCTTIASLMLLYDNYMRLELENDEIDALKPDLILALVKQELLWLQKLQDSEGGVYHKVTLANDEEEDGGLYVFPVSTCATADFSAIMAKAYSFYEKSDEKFAKSCLEASEKAWSYLKDHSYNIIFNNPDSVTTSEFKDDDDRDERFWAAMELSLATKKSDYVNYVSEHLDTGFNIGFTWQMVAGYGIFDGLRKGKDIFSEETYTRIQSIMNTRVNSIQNHVDTINYQVTYDSTVTFQTVISEATTLFLMGRYLKDFQIYCCADVFLDYLMGNNVYSENYIGEPQQIDSLDMDYIAKIVILMVGLNEVY